MKINFLGNGKETMSIVLQKVKDVTMNEIFLII
jgi:hypothetical protein